MHYTKDLDIYVKAKPFHYMHDEQLKYTELKFARTLNYNIQNTIEFIKSLGTKGLSRDRIRFIIELLTSRLKVQESLVN